MKQRSLLIQKYKDAVPLVAFCTGCRRKFLTIAALFGDPRGAEEYLVGQFNLHECHKWGEEPEQWEEEPEQ
jgi:hypothetical protein